MLLRDNVYENLRSDILTCRLAPGDDMREQDLAERYAVSRQPVREALLRLEREHLVTVQPRQGYRVNPISLSDARDLLRFRRALEPACVAEAIENASDEMLRGLDAFRGFAGDHEDFIAYNRGFHSALAQASGNRRMAAALCDLIGQADRLVRVSVANVRGHDPAQLVAEHVALIEATCSATSCAGSCPLTLATLTRTSRSACPIKSHSAAAMRRLPDACASAEWKPRL